MASMVSIAEVTRLQVCQGRGESYQSDMLPWGWHDMAEYMIDFNVLKQQNVRSTNPCIDRLVL